MGPDSPQSVTLVDGPGPLTPSARGRRAGTSPASVAPTDGGTPTRLVPSPPLMTLLAFAIVVVPFVIILVRVLLAPAQHLYLPDDLALIDLHARRALVWKQQLGVFDRNNWNHPGPSYFYLLSLVYRLLGSGAKAMFFGATLINALAAVGCVAVVRRRSTPARALWAAVWVCVLAGLLALAGPGATTYSEGSLGALVSPWNPMVIILPLLLFIVLCAGAMDRSPLSLVGAALVGTFIVQTNISALPLVAVLFVVAAATWAVTAVGGRLRRWTGGSRDPDGAPGDAAAPSAQPVHRRRRRTRWRGWVLAGAGLVAFVLMWLPPFTQQLANHPGNFTLIYRFFAAGHPGRTLVSGVWSMVSVMGVLVVGPSEVMRSLLGDSAHHAAVAVAVTIVVLLVAIAATVLGVRQRRRFAAGLGTLSLIGCAAVVVSVTHVVGFIFGYLVVWSVAVPVAALIGVGMVRLPLWSRTSVRRPLTSTTAFRSVLCGLGLAASILLAVRVTAIPALGVVSDPNVGRLASVVTPALDPHGHVFVGDNDAGGTNTNLLDTEEFIGLVNELDQAGYHPTVNHVWKAQFGPGYVTSGHEGRQIQLYTWDPTSPSMPGYVGQVGDMAVTVTGPDGQPVAH